MPAYEMSGSVVKVSVESCPKTLGADQLSLAHLRLLAT